MFAKFIFRIQSSLLKNKLYLYCSVENIKSNNTEKYTNGVMSLLFIAGVLRRDFKQDHNA